jgi:hypothetical protein
MCKGVPPPSWIKWNTSTKDKKKKENKINAGWKSKINNEKKTKQRKLKQKERKSGNLNGRKTCSRNYLKRGTGRQAVMNL